MFVDIKECTWILIDMVAIWIEHAFEQLQEIVFCGNYCDEKTEFVIENHLYFLLHAT